MADVLRRTGTNFTLLIPDDELNINLNGSTPGSPLASLAGFVGTLWTDGEAPVDLTALQLPPFNLTIDNVSDVATPFGMYRLNIDLTTRNIFELFIKHTTDMIAFRRESWDMVTRAEALSVIRGNTRITFTLATVVNTARNVAVGVLDTGLFEHRFDGAPNFDPANIAATEIIEFVYAALGDTNPILVRPA